MDKKSYIVAPIEVKEEGDQGIVKAVIATLNVIDKDGDVTLPGAFGDQRVKLSAWGHNWGALPVGKGIISEKGDEAHFDGQFFLDTAAGRDHFTTVKNLGDLGEWSYGFEVKTADRGDFEGTDVRFLRLMECFEASPVMRGAGIDTRTTVIKAENGEEKAWRTLEVGEHTDFLTEEVKALLARYQSVIDDLESEGRLLTGSKRDRLFTLSELWPSVGDKIAELLKRTEQPTPEFLLGLRDEMERIGARIERLGVS